MKKIVSEDENNDVYQTFVDLFKKFLALNSQVNYYPVVVIDPTAVLTQSIIVGSVLFPSYLYYF